MAEKRMFTKAVVDSDAFLDMPLSAQALYFHLNMRADDDGFIGNPKRVQSLIGASIDDMKLLVAKRFILAFEDGVIVIKHWRMHNTIRSDRYKATAYQDELSSLLLKENKSYSFNNGKPIVNRLATSGKQIASTVLDLDLDIVKDMFDYESKFELFWKEYPNKVNKKKSKDKFKAVCKNEETYQAIMDGLKIQKKSDQWLKGNGQFIPHPITWLNGERWNDELTQTNSSLNLPNAGDW